MVSSGRIFLIADNHFSEYDGQDDVIHIFHRKYPNSAKMNADMIQRWNTVVQPQDTVFSIGDFAWLWYEMKTYASQLSGKKVFVLGNHDFEGEPWHKSFDWRRIRRDGIQFDNVLFPYLMVLTHGDRGFLLVHDPADVPKWWRGWTIHGHHHWMPEYPFIDGRNKNVNVACERVDFTPVCLDDILKLDIDSIKWMETLNSEPERW